MPNPTRVAVGIATRLRDLHPLLQRLGKMAGEPLGETSLCTEAADELMRLSALLTAAEARGAAAERARLAALTEGEVREMVEAWGQAVFATAIATERRNFDPAIPDKADAAKSTLLAAFAAQRERVVGEWIAGLTDEQLWELGSEEWYPYDRKPNGGGMRAGVATPEVMRRRIRALLAPPDAKGVG